MKREIKQDEKINEIPKTKSKWYLQSNEKKKEYIFKPNGWVGPGKSKDNRQQC